MKFFFAIACSLISNVVQADSKLIFDGRIYALAEQAKEKCYDVGSPEYSAQQVVLDFAQKNGEAMAKALCETTPKYCDKKEQMRFGIERVFEVVRKLPIRFKSSGCAALRDECQKRCETTALYITQECSIECNQYESYNRN